MQSALAAVVQADHLLKQVAVAVQVAILRVGLGQLALPLSEQVERQSQVVHQMVLLANQQFMEWSLLAVAVVVGQHLPRQTLELLVVAVLVEALMVALLEHQVLVELVTQAHLLVVLVPRAPTDRLAVLVMVQVVVVLVTLPFQILAVRVVRVYQQVVAVLQ
jgi:hypothetical protein